MALNHLSKEQLESQLETFRTLNNLEKLEEEKVGNSKRTELELKRAALIPKTALSNEAIRQVRAAALDMSQYQYEQLILDLGEDY